jgi:hypothetical protein
MEGVTGTKGPQCPGAVGVRSPDIELVEALEKAHQQVDILLAMVIEFDNTFMPSQSPLWPEIERRAKLIRENGGWV